MRVALFTICIALSPGCGGQVEAPPIPVPPSASDFPPSEPSAVPYDPRLGALADVPGGATHVGDWTLSVPSFAIAPNACSELITPNARVIVAPFRLMVTEVTNGEYAVCVDGGACTEPPDVAGLGGVSWRDASIVNRPVIVSWSQARGFCRHYGGDLPTSGEFQRAEGADDTPGQPSLVSKWQACRRSGSPVSPECARITDPFSSGARSLQDVGQDPSDVGPYGHHDLFGNADEWERALLETPASQDLCAWPLDDHDVYRAPDAVHPFVYFPVGSLAASAGPDAASEPPFEVPDLRPDGYYKGEPSGFRCAFPIPATDGSGS